MKNILLALAFMSSIYASAQSEEGLFEVEYEQNGKELKSFAFTIDNCSQNIIYKSWGNWVANKEGTPNFFKKNEASDVVFKNSQNIYKATISFVEEEKGKTTVINSLIDQEGVEFSRNSPDFDEIHERLRDLSYQIKQTCVRNDLRLANENMVRLTKESTSAQTEKGNAIKSNLKDNNTLLKLENKKQVLNDKLDLLVNQLERTSDDKDIDELMKRKLKLESSIQKLEDQVVSLNAGIVSKEERNKVLDLKINDLTTQIQQQRSVIEKFQNKYSSIAR